MKSIQKIAKKVLASQFILVDEQLIISCHSLIKNNGGRFVSDKQANFFKYKLSRGDRDAGYPFILKKDDLGIITGEFKTYGNYPNMFKNRWMFVIDPEGVREKYLEKMKLVQGKSKEQVDYEYSQLPFKQREQVWGLQSEEVKDRWDWAGLKKYWERSSAHNEKGATMNNVQKIAKEILSAFGRPSIQGPKTKENIVKYIRVKNSVNYGDLIKELKFLVNEGVYWEDALLAIEDLNPKVKSDLLQKEFKKQEGISLDSYTID